MRQYCGSSCRLQVGADDVLHPADARVLQQQIVCRLPAFSVEIQRLKHDIHALAVAKGETVGPGFFRIVVLQFDAINWVSLDPTGEPTSGETVAAHRRVILARNSATGLLRGSSISSRANQWFDPWPARSHAWQDQSTRCGLPLVGHPGAPRHQALINDPGLENRGALSLASYSVAKLSGQ